MIKTILRFWIGLIVSMGLITACTPFTGENQTGEGTRLNAAATSATNSYSGGAQGSRSSLMGGVVGQENADVLGNASAIGESGDFWTHLRSDFQWSSYDNEPAVQEQISWFVHHQDYFNRTISRAAPYMYYILQQAEERNLPGELVLLPVLESAYNPNATSYAGAVGMWQLMRATARGYGIKQDSWYDGRRDVYASTNAALDFLTYLQNYFGGDWLLALAGYNSGEGTVQNAVRRNALEGRDSAFWDLSLPMQTRSYVPRLLAIADIIRDPGKYGMVLPEINNQPYMTQVDTGQPIGLEKAAQMAGLSLKELKQLNPGYSHTTMDPNGPYKIILPIDRVATFKQELAVMPPQPKIVALPPSVHTASVTSAHHKHHHASAHAHTHTVTHAHQKTSVARHKASATAQASHHATHVAVHQKKHVKKSA